MENNLLNPNQSGFMPGDSRCFLDISNAFDRVWHEGLIYKTKCMGVKGVNRGLVYKTKCMGVKVDLLTLIKSFLFERQQKSCSEWTRI